LVNDSPIARLLAAVDSLNVEAAVALVAPDCRMLAVDGTRANGSEAMRKLLSDFFATLRSMSHHITAQWHVDDVWIAEVDGSYELIDWLQLNGLPRAFVLRDGPEGFVELRVYGAHERPLTDHRTGEEGMRIGERWIPPL
jgi:hypothetical protein